MQSNTVLVILIVDLHQSTAKERNETDTEDMIEEITMINPDEQGNPDCQGLRSVQFPFEHKDGIRNNQHKHNADDVPPKASAVILTKYNYALSGLAK